MRIRPRYIYGLATALVGFILLFEYVLYASQRPSRFSTSTSTSYSTSSTTSGIEPCYESGTCSAPSGDRFMRIRALDGPNWGGNVTYDAQDFLSWISAYQPQWLERYFDKTIDPNESVPVCSTCQPMTVLQFLDASEQACNCGIIPRLSLDTYISSPSQFYSLAQSYLNLQLTIPIRYLSLDNWDAYNQQGYSQQTTITMFQTLYAQGWQGIGVNDCGGAYTTYGYATWADFCIQNGGSNPSDWVPRSDQLSQLDQQSNIKLKLLYIDFPQPMTDFANDLSVNQEADVLLNNVISQQSSGGFVFVYMVYQSFWDATTRYTTSGSTYGGQSLYQLMQGWINQYN